jgi:hypothetical protein
MKPFSHRTLAYEEKNFNYRLSRARRVVKNAFGILSSRFRIFHTAINLRPDKVETLGHMHKPLANAFTCISEG